MRFFLLFACSEPVPELDSTSLKKIPKKVIISEDPPSKPPVELKTGDGCMATQKAQDEEKNFSSFLRLQTRFTEMQSNQILLGDILSPESGEIHWQFTCIGSEIAIDVPSNLGKVQLAVFVDDDKNGPSSNDIQGISPVFFLEQTDIQLDPISASTDASSFYNFNH